jgi:ABC-2 type transport system permease protein
VAKRGVGVRWSSAAGLVALAAVLVVVGLMSREWYVRADLTEEDEFTISRSTSEILARLDDVVTVTVYMNRDLPSTMTGFRTRIEDTLSEYRARGRGKVVVRFVDPSADETAESEARELGIRPVQLQTVDRDRAEIVSTYAGLTVTYAGRLEVVPLVLVPERLEYELSAAILALTAEERPVVAFLTGHGERTPGSDYSLAAEALAHHYDVVEVDPGDGAPALSGVDVLIVAGAEEVPDAELYVVDQFIMRGGRALFLLDAVVVPPDGTRGRASTGNVYDFVSRYGADVRPELVVDPVSESAAFRTGFATMAVPYPFWPKAAGEGVSRKHPVVAELDAIAFPWTSPIERTGGLTDSVRYEAIARSSTRSWTVPAATNLEPQRRVEPPPEQARQLNAGRGPGYDLIVSLTGRFESAFRGAPVLVPDGRGGAVSTYPEGRLNQSVPTQLMVVGNARMFDDDFMMRSPSSPVVFLNAVDWLARGELLLDVRSRAIDDRPLEEVSETGRMAARTLGTFGVPLAVVLFGVARTWRRRRRSGRPHTKEAA